MSNDIKCVKKGMVNGVVGYCTYAVVMYLVCQRTGSNDLGIMITMLLNI